MRVLVEESHKGEIEGLTAAELHDKLDKAFGFQRELLAKAAGINHGKVDAIDDLQALLAGSYERRLKQMAARVVASVR